MRWDRAIIFTLLVIAALIPAFLKQSKYLDNPKDMKVVVEEPYKIYRLRVSVIYRQPVMNQATLHYNAPPIVGEEGSFSGQVIEVKELGGLQ